MNFYDKMATSLYRSSVDPTEGFIEDQVSPIWSQLHNDLDELETFAEDLSRELSTTLKLSVPYRITISGMCY